MGGGTGTGAAPVIVSVARELGCVTIAIVTEPFRFEGMQRGRQAAAGLEELRSCADTVLVVANDRLTDIVPKQMTMTNAFLVADDVLRQGVRWRGCWYGDFLNSAWELPLGNPFYIYLQSAFYDNKRAHQSFGLDLVQSHSKNAIGMIERTVYILRSPHCV